MNNKEKLYLAKSAMTEDSKSQLQNWIRGVPQQQSPAPSMSDMTGPSYTPTINNGFTGTSSQGPTRYKRNFQNDRLSHLQTHGNFGNALMANPVGRGNTKALNTFLNPKEWESIGNTALDKGKKLIKGESTGLVDWMNDQGPTDFMEGDFGAGSILNTANPRPLIDGVIGMGYDAATFTDMMAQGAAGGGYERPEWSKNGPSFVGGIGNLGKSLYHDPLGTLKSVAVGEGSLYNVLGGASTVGKLGGLGTAVARNPVKTTVQGVRASARSLKDPKKTYKNYRNLETNVNYEDQVPDGSNLATSEPTNAPIARADIDTPTGTDNTI